MLLYIGYFLSLIVGISLAFDSPITEPTIITPPPINFGILGLLDIPAYPEIMNSVDYKSINLTIKTLDDLMQGMRSDKVRVDFSCSDPYIVLDKPSLTIMRGDSSFLLIRRNQDFSSPWSTLVEKAAEINVKVSFLRGPNTLIRTISSKSMPVSWKFSGAHNSCYIAGNLVKDVFGVYSQSIKGGFHVLARTSTMAIYGVFDSTTGILESILYNYMGIITEAKWYNGKKWFFQHRTVHPVPDPTQINPTYSDNADMVSFSFPDGTSFYFSRYWENPVIHFQFPQFHQLDGLCNMASASMQITQSQYYDMWSMQFPIADLKPSTNS